MAREYRFMRALMGLKARTTAVGDGWRTTTVVKSGSDCFPGSSHSAPRFRAHLRHLEDMTEKYPDICHLILNLLFRHVESRPDFPSSASAPTERLVNLLHSNEMSSLIIDAEVVAVDKDTGAHRTFQELTNRAKKDVKVEDIKVVVAVYAFDLMLLNDKVDLCQSNEYHDSLTRSRSWIHHSRIADTSFVPSFRHSPIPRTPFWHVLTTSNPLIRPTARIRPRKCRRFSSRWSSKSVRG